MKSVLESHALGSRLERLQEENAQLKRSVPRLHFDGRSCQLLVAGNLVYGTSWQSMLSRQSWSLEREQDDGIEKLSLVSSGANSLLVITTSAHSPTITIGWHQYYSFDCAAATAHVLLDDCEALVQIDSIGEAAREFIAAGRKLVDATRKSVLRATK